MLTFTLLIVSTFCRLDIVFKVISKYNNINTNNGKSVKNKLYKSKKKSDDKQAQQTTIKKEKNNNNLKTRQQQQQ